MATWTRASTHQRERRRRRHPLMEWYEKTTGVLIDRMCCCSYSEGQIFNEAEPIAFDAFKTAIVPPAWAAMDDTYVDDLDPEVASSAKTSSKSKITSTAQPAGHLTLRGSDPYKTGLRLDHSPVGLRSVTTETTVSSSTVRTLPTFEEYSTDHLDGYGQRDGLDSVQIRGSKHAPVKTHDIGRRRNVYHHSCSDSQQPARYESERHSKHLTCPINCNSLPNLPYLTLTEGYEV